MTSVLSFSFRLWIAPMNKIKVYKSNAILESSYRLSVQEQRIVLACIAKIRKDEVASDEKFYEVTVQDLLALTPNSKSKNSYEVIESAAKRLYRREIWIEKAPNGKGNMTEVLATRWVQSIKYIKGQGLIQLRFSKDILPYLNELSSEFTRYALSDIANMDSSHAIRLYELLHQYLVKGEREILIDDLRKWLQIEDKYPSSHDIKRYVVDVAIKQINELSPLTISYTQKKRGRRVHSFIFKIKSNDPTLSKNPKRKKTTRKEAEKEGRPGEGWNELVKRLSPTHHITDLKNSLNDQDGMTSK